MHICIMYKHNSTTNVSDWAGIPALRDANQVKAMASKAKAGLIIITIITTIIIFIINLCHSLSLCNIYIYIHK